MRRGHRQDGPLPATLKPQRRSVWFHPVVFLGSAAPRSCFSEFPRRPHEKTGMERRGGGGEREAAHHWRRWGNEVTESESECDAKEKFTKQLLFGSAGVTTEEETGLIGLLCYCVSLNKSEGC